MADTAKHVIFSGRVQGVGFRYTCHRIVMRYDLTGFVRNLPGSSVELLIQGHPQNVADCLADIKESFGAYISDTNAVQLPPDPRYTNFRITF